MIAAEASTLSAIAVVLSGGGLLTGAAALWRARAESRAEDRAIGVDARRVGIEEVKQALDAQAIVIARLTERNTDLSRKVAECVDDRAVLHSELDEQREVLSLLKRRLAVIERINRDG